MDTIRPGKYKHFKGNNYQVIGEATHTETGEKLVVYTPLYQADSFEPGALFVRPLSMFTETIIRAEKEVKRFKFVGEPWNEF